MSEFNQFFLMKTEDVKRYAVEVLKFFEPNETLQSVEIGDGNINYVFKVWSEESGKSVVVKQADKFLRSSGRPLDIYRNKIEAAILQLEYELSPSYIPKVYYYDETMAALSMEDISAYKNLRKELMENRVYSHLSENISTFLADTLLPTTDLVLDRKEKKEKAKFFVNPELCDITEDLVLTEPYYDYKKRNIITKGNEEFVKELLYDDKGLHEQVAQLRNKFMNYSQGLIHGDLHSGSIFANQEGMKVIDPEFAFYGPIGYDIGNVIGNLFFSLANKKFVMEEQEDAIKGLEKTIREIYDMTYEKMLKQYEKLVKFPLYTVEDFKKAYLKDVMADAMGYAGTEIIRRVVGDTKVMEISSVSDLDTRVSMERALIKLGIAFIKNRQAISSGQEVIDMFKIVLQ